MERICVIIGDGAFNNYVGIKNVVIPNTVTKIGDYAFDGCTSLESIMIPNSVTVIGDGAFYRCANLKSADLPENVEYIGDFAFCECTSLESVTIPRGVTKINLGTFWGCTSLESVIIPDSVTEIGFGAFIYCSSLKSIEIPDSVTQIGGSAFGDCSSLENIIIPDGVTKIGDFAFSYCARLESVTVPDSVTEISDTAFRDCSNVVFYGKERGSYAESYARRMGFTFLLIKVSGMSILDNFKNNYTQGDEIDTSGGSLFVVYNNGVTEIVPITPEMVTGFDSTKPGRQTVTIIYEGRTANFEVYVEELSIVAIIVTKVPDKVTYYKGEELDLSGLEVTAEYNNGVTEIVPITPEMVTGFDSTKLGDQTLTISYGGKTCEFTVTVTRFVYGDLTGDGNVSVSDAILVLKHVAGWNITINEAAADVNCDGNVSVADAILILKFVANWNVVLGPTGE